MPVGNAIIPAALESITVLVTDASYKHSVGIIRALGKAGCTVCAVSHHAHAPGFYSRHTAKSVIVPNPAGDQEGFVESVLRVIREINVDVIIPVGFSSVRAVSCRLPDFQSAGLAPVLPGVEDFDTCADKWGILKIAREAGLLTPETILATDEDTIRSFLDTHGRCVAKYRRESRGKGVVYLDERQDWLRRLSKLPSLARSDGSPETIIQEFIPGVGQGYMALAWHGRVVREFAHRRLREMPPEGGAATAAVSIDDSSLLSAGRRLIDATRWHGPAMVEFRSNESGHYVVEFNPKYWGSLELALASGADFPEDHCRLSLDDDLSWRDVPTYRAGLKFWWPWRGDLRRLLWRPGDSPSVLNDMLSPRVQSNWMWRDPLPNLVEAVSELTYPFRRNQ